MDLIASLPSDARTQKTNGNLFFACVGGLSFCACFLFRTHIRTPSWAEPGRAASLGGKKAPWARPESFFPLWLPSRPLFSLGHLFFYLARRTHAPRRGGICCLRASTVCFPGHVFFGRTDARFPGRGPDGKLVIKFTFPFGILETVIPIWPPH